MNKKMILPLLTVFLFSSCHKAENETIFTESIPDTESIVQTTTAESSISVPEPSEPVRKLLLYYSYIVSKNKLPIIYVLPHLKFYIKATFISNIILNIKNDFVCYIRKHC